MNHLPILQELFESDSIVFMLIGFLLALFLGIMMKDCRKTIISLVVSFVLYAVCEGVSNIHTNNLIELILLFVGTAAIGGILGFLISAIIAAARKK